ncbi:hypothetical protein AVEN_60376-1 [Araneus ventricosus]|uniref:Uncharacterized protein n=1 Tax=Araneus ventricosus TaxID=182803 RepID=A0A4Y2H5N2_ARAVE|nr:hypothetical protein AVEN_60376-1 [Araneus ventricosus]
MLRCNSGKISHQENSKPSVMSPLFPTTAGQTTSAEVPEATTQDEHKWVINLPTSRKPTWAQRSAVSLTDHTRVSRQRPPVKIDHNQSTP